MHADRVLGRDGACGPALGDRRRAAGRWRRPCAASGLAARSGRRGQRRGRPRADSSRGCRIRRSRRRCWIMCVHAGLRAAVIIPIAIGGQRAYALAVELVRAERRWPPALVARLRLVAEILASAALSQPSRGGAPLRSRRGRPLDRGTRDRCDAAGSDPDHRGGVRRDHRQQSDAQGRAGTRERKLRRRTARCCCSAKPGPARS